MAQELVSNTLLFIGVVVGPLSLLILMLWFVGLSLRDLSRKLIQARQLRSTPCHRCLYFSGCEELKCAVNPYEVLTQAANNCSDFEPSSSAKQIIGWYHKL